MYRERFDAVCMASVAVIFDSIASVMNQTFRKRDSSLCHDFEATTNPNTHGKLRVAVVSVEPYQAN